MGGPAVATMRLGPKAKTADHELDLSMLPEKRDYRRIAAFAQEFLRVPKGTGAGEPFRLRPWQVKDVTRKFYPPTGRRPRQGLLSIARGNGKTGLAAVYALYGLLADGVDGAQVLTVASDERQARIVFAAARRMLELDERLAEQVQVYGDRLYVPRTDSMMMPMPAEPAALQGWDPSLVIVDELHVVNAAVWEAIALAAGKRPESLTLAISTPADSADSIMWQLVDYGRKNPDDRTFALVEYAAADGCAVDDWDEIARANPALDDFLHRDAVEATMRTTAEDAWRRYRLGQWVGAANSWLPWGEWEKRAGDPEPPAPGERVVLAFDGSASGDSTALVGAVVDTGRLFVVAAWQSPADDPHWRVPRREVTAMVAAAYERWDVVELAADPWGWRTELEEWRDTHGGVVEWNTAHAGRMAPATDRMYAAVMTGELEHDGHELLAEHVGHCVAKRTPMGDLVSKDKRSSTRRIDLAVAAIVAYDRAAWHRANPPKRRRVAAFAG